MPLELKLFMTHVGRQRAMCMLFSPRFTRVTSVSALWRDADYVKDTVATSSVRAFSSLWLVFLRPLRLVRTDGLVED